MNNYKLNYILIGFVIFAAGFAAVWYFFFTIYEIKIFTEPNVLIAHSAEPAEIKIIPLNMFGKRVPFRNVPFSFTLVGNNDIVSLSKSTIENNLLYVIPKRKTGEVEIKIISKYSLFTNIVRISVIRQRN